MTVHPGCRIGRLAPFYSIAAVVIAAVEFAIDPDRRVSSEFLKTSCWVGESGIKPSYLATSHHNR